MSEITNPPTVPEISTPVPQRTDPENFSVLMDRFLREMPVTVDGINLTVSWTYDTVQVVKEFSQAAAKSVDDAAQQVELAKKEVQLAKGEVALAKQEVSKARSFAQDSAASAEMSERLREEAEALVALAGEKILPEYTVANAPLVSSAGHAGVQFSARSLDYGLPTSYFGIDREQAPLNKDLGELSRLNRDEVGSLSLSRYDTSSVLTESVIDLSVAQVFTLDVSKEPKSVSFKGVPDRGRAMVFIVNIEGKAGVVWPKEVVWRHLRAPLLKQQAMLVFLVDNGVIEEVGRNIT